MGDYTWVQVTVLREHVNAAAAALEVHPDSFVHQMVRYERAPSGNSQAIYAQLADVEQKPFPTSWLLSEIEMEEADPQGDEFLVELVQAGVPFDLRHAKGEDYGEGQMHLRFDSEGNPLIWDYEDFSLSNLPLARVQKTLWGPVTDEGIAHRLRTLLQRHKEDYTVMPWAGQHENAKKARVIKTIAGEVPPVEYKTTG